MCDYSLHAVETRPAVVGDKMVTTEFAFTCTRGFADVNERTSAVCLMPGTEVVFEKEVAQGLLSTLLRRPSYGRVARFRKINMDSPIKHHDALEFADGRVLLVNDMRPGQTATVLQLPNFEAGKFDKTEDRPIQAGTQRLEGARIF